MTSSAMTQVSQHSRPRDQVDVEARQVDAEYRAHIRRRLRFLGGFGGFANVGLGLAWWP
jgi:hypothetical protein